MAYCVPLCTNVGLYVMAPPPATMAGAKLFHDTFCVTLRRRDEIVHSTDRPVDRRKNRPAAVDMAHSRLEVASGSRLGDTRSDRVCEVGREKTVWGGAKTRACIWGKCAWQGWVERHFKQKTFGILMHICKIESEGWYAREVAVT